MSLTWTKNPIRNEMRKGTSPAWAIVTGRPNKPGTKNKKTKQEQTNILFQMEVKYRGNSV